MKSGVDHKRLNKPILFKDNRDMTHDFNIASQYADILRDEKFMAAMSKIGSSVIALIADDSDRGARFDAYARQNNIGAQMEEYANGFCHFEGPTILDSFAVSQMIRLLMKENSLAAAFESGAVNMTELVELGILDGVITDESINALSRMGAHALAAVAALNMR